MLYITGIHALNLTCSLDTPGDWHTSAIQWNNPKQLESTCSLLGDYGIETNREIPENTEKYNVANHIRALLDLIIEENYSLAQGMREELICNEKYTREIFDKVFFIMANSSPSKQGRISSFMGREYRTSWLDYIEGRNT